MSPTPSDMLLVMAPPIRLVRWLEKVIPAREQKGETVPQEIKDWLRQWDDIRSHVPVPAVDNMSAADWDEVGEVVGKYVTESVV